MILLNFIASDFEGDFLISSDCAIGRATKRELKWTHPIVGTTTAEDFGEKRTKEYFIRNVRLNGEIISGFSLGCDEFDKIKDSEFKSASVELHEEEFI